MAGGETAEVEVVREVKVVREVEGVLRPVEAPGVALPVGEGRVDVLTPGKLCGVKVGSPLGGLVGPVMALPRADPRRKGQVVVAQSRELAISLVSPRSPRSPGVAVQLVGEGRAERLGLGLPAGEQAVDVETPVVLGSIVGGGPGAGPLGLVVGDLREQVAHVGVEAINGVLNGSREVVVAQGAAVLGVGGLGARDQLLNAGTGLLGAGLDVGPDLRVELLPLSSERAQVELGVRGAGVEKGSVGGCGDAAGRRR